MKNIFILVLTVSFFFACSNDKMETGKEEAEKEVIEPVYPNKVEDLKKIDTANYMKNFPHLRKRDAFGVDMEYLTAQQRIYTFKARSYFGENMNKEGSLGSRLVNMVMRDTLNGKKIDRNYEATDLKFADGQATLQGVDSDEMKILAMYTYLPVPLELYFTMKTNVNTADPALRKERINNLRKAIIASGADVYKFTFDENAEPKAKEGTISFKVIRKNKKD